MKKYKLISSICAAVLVLAFLAFGIYAATRSSFSVNSKVFFEVSDVLVKVNYGIENVKDLGPYYSDEIVGTPLLNSVENLPHVTFTEESYTCTYYVTIENLHRQDIYLRLGYTWNDSTRYEGNAITIESEIYNNTQDTHDEIIDVETSTREDGYTKSKKDYNSEEMVFVANETITLKVSLILLQQAMDYTLNGGLNLRVSAGLREAPEF